MNKFESYSSARPWFMALLLSALAIGCGGGGRDPILGIGGGSGVVFVPPAGGIIPGAVCTVAASPTIPRVTSSNPTNGNQFVTTSSNGVAGGGKLITATFSLPMDATTINATTFMLAPVGGAALIPVSVSYNAATRVATLTTASALLVNTSYTAVIQGVVRSAAGTAIGCNYVWTFKTATVAAAGLAPVNLGLLTPFAIASAGGITNSNATKINGDVVLNPNQTCNAAPVGAGDDFGANCNTGENKVTNNAGDKVITQIHPDTTTADAVRAELLAKWNSISPAGTPGATVLGCGTIGSAGDAGALIGCSGNSTLPPGAYISATDSSIDVSGDLTLDARGNADAVWVFQAPSSTVITAVNSRILLTGGAKASNVFWQVGSSADLKTGTLFQGNILASASISMGTGTTSCGRLLSGAEGAGAFTFLANTVSVPGHPNAPTGCQ